MCHRCASDSRAERPKAVEAHTSTVVNRPAVMMDTRYGR